MQLIQQLWQDETGVMSSAELILISTLLLIGSIVGLTTLRDQIVQEFGDMGLAVGEINQSYTVAPVDLGGGFTAAGSSFEDLADFCQEPDVAGQPPACISVTIPASEEAN